MMLRSVFVLFVVFVLFPKADAATLDDAARAEGEVVLYSSLNNEQIVTLVDAFKKKYSGFSAWVLTANSEAAKHIGLRPSRKIQLFNGSLECRFLKFDLYAGTKKIHKLAAKDISDETD